MKVEKIVYINVKDALLKAIPDIIDDTVKVLTKDAKAEAPVITGFLRSSIKGTIGNKKGMVKVWAPYGIYVEFGTMYRKKANPFFRRALDNTKRLLPTIIRRNWNRFF